MILYLTKRLAFLIFLSHLIVVKPASVIMFLLKGFGYLLTFELCKLLLKLLDVFQGGPKMVLFYDYMLVFAIQVFYGLSSISEVELVDGFQSDFYFVNFFIAIVFKHEVTTPINLLLILLDSLVHLPFEPHFYRQSKFLRKAILHVDQDYEEKNAATFQFYMIALELSNLLVG